MKREIWSPAILGWQYRMRWMPSKKAYVYKHTSGRKGRNSGYVILYKPKTDYFNFHRVALFISVYLPSLGMERITVHVERRADRVRDVKEMWSTAIQAFERHIYFRLEEGNNLQKQVDLMKGD